MVEETVTTGVDKLLEYLEGKEKVSLKEAAETIKISEETLQLWVDFLVEERIVGMEYKFTKPYIYLNKKTKTAPVKKREKTTFKMLKEEYIENAKKKQISEEKAEEFWINSLTEAIDKREDYFYKEAKKRNLDDPIELFGLYKRKVLSEERGDSK
ncbi:MAG: hypothetical protein ACOCU6_00245 [Nanoarchaeota archaeon]